MTVCLTLLSHLLETVSIEFKTILFLLVFSFVLSNNMLCPNKYCLSLNLKIRYPGGLTIARRDLLFQ